VKRRKDKREERGKRNNEQLKRKNEKIQVV
jgi:hypothetical protein